MQTLANKVQLIGYLGMDPEMKSFDNGTKLLRVSLATDASYKDRDGKRVQDTHWHTLTAWGKTAELAEKLLKKGKQVAIEGKLVNRSYEDQEGNKRFSTEVRMEQFMLLGRKED